MDADRFDAVSRSLAVTGSRRHALAAALGGLLGALGMPGIEAQGRKKKSCGRCRRRKQGKCKPKRNGTPCGVGKACQGGRCVKSPPTCSDGIKNGSETDVDCGGTCPRCTTGKRCASRNDCASARCAGGVCQTCNDPNTDCGTDADGSMCACRDHESGQRFCTKTDGRVLGPGTPCAACQGGEQCFPIDNGNGGINCILPCGATTA